MVLMMLTYEEVKMEDVVPSVRTTEGQLIKDS